MADDKKKLDFGKLGKRKKSTSKPAAPKKVYQEVVAQPPATEPTKTTAKVESKKEKKKVGRKSWKQPDVKYIRVAFDTPVATRQKLKQLLVGKFYETYISQDEMINVAIDDFIKKHSK